MDLKHKIEKEKDLPANREKRLKDNWPLPYPLSIAIELSSDCNSNCYMCPRKNMTRAGGKMDLKLFKKIIDELHKNKVLLRKLFLHWMGEPLLNESFNKMIAYAKKKNIAEMVVMASNLIALDEDKAERLVKSGLDELFVSLDAVRQETYDKIKGNSASLEKVEDSIYRLVETRKKMGSSLPYIRLKILKSSVNRDEIEEFKDKWSPVVDEIYVEEDLNAWNGTNQDVNKNIKGDPLYKEKAGADDGRWPCDRLWYQLAISQDGFVSPCIADWNGTGFIGNVKNESVFDIWHSPKLKEMRRKHIDGKYGELEMCKDCQRWQLTNLKNWLKENKDKALKQ